MSVEEDYFILFVVELNRDPITSGGQFTETSDVKSARQCSLLLRSTSYLVRGGGEEEKGIATKRHSFRQNSSKITTFAISELEKIATVHLYVMGYRGDDLINFKLKQQPQRFQNYKS